MNASSPPPSTFHIDAAKITAYLLNPVHLTGGAKARFFIGHGFHLSRPDEFADSILSHARTSPLVHAGNNGYVDKFTYEGTLAGPRGPIPFIRSVWKVEAGNTYAELMTAYRF